jgi:DNA replication and repair protein RecF
MDGIISQFNRTYLDDLMRYGKVLEQRNALLKNMGDYGFFNPENIEVWDEQLAKYGTRIYAQRKIFLEEFIPVFQKYYSALTDDQERVSLDYKSQMDEDDLLSLLRNAHRKDFRKQYSTVGTHKDDLVFTIKEHPVKKFGSQGQQKSFLIALRLSQFDWLNKHLGIKPVLLLDDIFDKLDNNRVERLMKMVSNNDFGQVLVTDTDGRRIDAIFSSINKAFKLFEVNQNEVKAKE